VCFGEGGGYRSSCIAEQKFCKRNVIKIDVPDAPELQLQALEQWKQRASLGNPEYHWP